MTYGGSQTNTSFPSFLGATVPINFTDFTEAGHNATFPRIVVIGDENSGKSSLLQRVAGQNVFPVSEKFCTRMPVVLSLKSGPDTGKICMRALRGNVELETLNIDTRDIGCVSDKVKGAIDTLNNTVNKERGVSFSDRSVLSDHSIEIRMARPDFPDIDFVDLPGLVADAGARDATAKLTESYLGDDNAILLWVVSDFSDSLRVNITLGLLQSAVSKKPAIQERVVVALTKSDKSINDENVGGRRIKERMSDLKTTFGFTPAAVVPVISRYAGFENSNLALQTEEQLLNEMNIPLPHGLNGLLSKVAEIAEKIVKTVWVPSVIKEMNTEMADLRKTIDGFGFPPAKLSPSAIRSSLTKTIWDGKDMTSDIFNQGLLSKDWPGTCPSEMSILKKPFFTLKPCERACINSLWDAQLSAVRKTSTETYSVIADGIIKASIDSFNGSIPVSSSHLKRIDFSFIVNNFKPIIPAYDISQKYTYHMSGKSVESAFEMHLYGPWSYRGRL